MVVCGGGGGGAGIWGAKALPQCPCCSICGRLTVWDSSQARAREATSLGGVVSRAHAADLWNETTRPTPPPTFVCPFCFPRIRASDYSTFDIGSHTIFAAQEYVAGAAVMFEVQPGLIWRTQDTLMLDCGVHCLDLQVFLHFFVSACHSINCILSIYLPAPPPPPKATLEGGGGG